MGGGRDDNAEAQRALRGEMGGEGERRERGESPRMNTNGREWEGIFRHVLQDGQDVVYLNVL